MKTVRKICCYSALLAGIAFLGAACGDADEEKDVTGPQIDLKDPEEGEEFAAGNRHGVHIEFDLADLSGLNAYKVDIHSGAGHSHSKMLKAVDWSYQKVYDDAKGLKNHHVHVHSDSIPADATLGEYHLGIS
ncbi:MAG: DUF4625 domain-containing protein, partial [Prevotellaceae bacterium]|nr:DUF4625 domain-containing protein [Prevotellaceae bacterium]